MAELWCHQGTFGATCVCLLFLECPTFYFLKFGQNKKVQQNTEPQVYIRLAPEEGFIAGCPQLLFCHSKDEWPITKYYSADKLPTNQVDRPQGKKQKQTR